MFFFWFIIHKYFVGGSNGVQQITTWVTFMVFFSYQSPLSETKVKCGVLNYLFQVKWTASFEHADIVRLLLQPERANYIYYSSNNDI